MIALAFVVALLFGATSSVAGARKGMAGSGFALGFLLGPIGLVIVLVSSGNRKACPTCREMVHEGASKCRFCGYGFPPPVMIDCPTCHHRYADDLTGCDQCGQAKPKAVTV